MLASVLLVVIEAIIALDRRWTAGTPWPRVQMARSADNRLQQRVAVLSDLLLALQEAGRLAGAAE